MISVLIRRDVMPAHGKKVELGGPRGEPAPDPYPVGLGLPVSRNSRK